MNKISIIFLILIFAAINANAQYFQTGQDPSSVSWKQINTDNFQIVYPEVKSLKYRHKGSLLFLKKYTITV